MDDHTTDIPEQNNEERYQRLAADFDNFRRRVEREKMRISWEARAKVLKEALELIDTIDRAALTIQEQKSALSADNSGLRDMLTGIELLQKASARFLEQQGVREVDQTHQFDPSLHEALVYTHDPQFAPGDIVEVFEKGYTLDGDLLRPARVSVNDHGLPQ
jgi:molecular chaperone GrpE